MSNVPKLRFNEFSGEWEKIKIQKLIDNKSIISHLDGNHGALYPRSEEFTKTGVPYVTANDFMNGKVDLKKCKYLHIERASKFKKGIAKNGDVLFAHNATVGPVALLETDLDYVILSTTATYYRCDNKRLLNNYLKVYFNTNDFIEQYSRVMSQSTRNQVPITTQRLFYIQLPTKPEQEKIASFLTSVDTKIEQLTKKEALLQEYKKGVMSKIFNQEIRFKDVNGSYYANWEEKKLSEIIDVIDGDRGINYPNGEELSNNGFCLFLNAKNVTKKGFKFEEKQFITKEKDNLLSKGKLKRHDIILTTRGTVGQFSFYDESIPFDNIRINSGMVILRNKNKQILNDYLYKLFNSSFFKTQIKKIAFGSAQPQLTVKEIKKFRIIIPQLEEQTKIANFLSSIDKKIELTTKELNSTKEFKKALLQQMFV